MHPCFRRSEPDPPISPRAVVRDVQGDGWRVRLDPSPQVLSLDIPETEVAWSYRQAELVLKGRVTVQFGSVTRKLAYPVFAEAYVSRLLDRDEFRGHCDRHKTAARILEHL